MLSLPKYKSVFRHYVSKIFLKRQPIIDAKRSIYPNLVFESKKVKVFKNEYNAVVNILCKSFLISKEDLSESVKVLLCGQQKNDEKNTDSKNSGKKSNSNSTDGDKDKNDDDEKVMSLFTKAILWMITVYLFITFLSLMFPSKSSSDTATRYVSWNEFVHHMLAAGEVKEVIIRPDMEMVTIILYDDAIIKGRKVDYNIYHMAIADASKFEVKLREEEKRLGITEGVSVTYDRHSDITGRLLVLLLLFTVFMSLISRIRGMKSPINMDTFVFARITRKLLDEFVKIKCNIWGKTYEE